MSITFYTLSVNLVEEKSKNGQEHVRCYIEVERGSGDTLATAFIARQKWKTLVFRASSPPSSVRKALSCLPGLTKGLSDEVIRIVRVGRSSLLQQSDDMLHRPNPVWGHLSWHSTGILGSSDKRTNIRHPVAFTATVREPFPFIYNIEWEAVL